jgi:hypothetical protein
MPCVRFCQLLIKADKRIAFSRPKSCAGRLSGEAEPGVDSEESPPATNLSDAANVIGRPRVGRCLILRVQAGPEYRSGASVAIVGGVHDKLIVEGDFRGKPRKAVIGLEDAFVTGMRQHPVAD